MFLVILVGVTELLKESEERMVHGFGCLIIMFLFYYSHIPRLYSNKSYAVPCL
jgi:hypothetical protein